MHAQKRKITSVSDSESLSVVHSIPNPRQNIPVRKQTMTAVDTAHTPGRWRLLYFDAPTRGEQIRLLFKISGVEFDDVRLEYPRGLEPYKTNTMGDDSPLCGTDLCPAVTSPDGEHCVETSDIMRLVGRAVGLGPASEADDKRAAAITVRAQEVLNRSFYKMLLPMVTLNILSEDLGGVMGYCIPTSFVVKKKKVEEARAELDRQATFFEDELISSESGPYFCGDSISYADVAVFCVLDQAFHFACFNKEECLEGRPRLTAWMETMAPKAEPWFKERAEKHQGGHYNIIEAFGALRSPLKWSRRTK